MAEGAFKIMTPGGYQRPALCSKCQGVRVYKGIGEYQCEMCGALEYDEYGLVRNYLDEHRGSNVAQIADKTGVSQKTIREMIKDNRFEVIDNPGGYIRCEVCGVDIKSGRYCAKCEVAYHRKMEDKVREAKQKNIAGYGDAKQGEEGSMRFTR